MIATVRYLMAGTLAGLAFAPPVLTAAPTFTEKSLEAGFQHRGETYGAAWGDYNGDGWPDLFVNNHREWAGLYRNNGDGTFTDVIIPADGSGSWKNLPLQDNHGATFADVDNDGDLDLYASTGGSVPGRMLVNQQNVYFDRSVDLNVGEDVEGRLPVFIDFNQDGRLDIAMMIRSASRVFRQNSDGTFRNITANTGLSCSGMSYGQLSDLNGDGAMDLICANGTFPTKIYDVTTMPFTDITGLVPKIPRGTDTAIADFNGDLVPDIFAVAGKKIPSQIKVYPNKSGLEAQVGVGPGVANGFTFKSSGVVTVALYVKRQTDSVNNFYIGASGTHPTAVPFTLDPTDPATHGIANFDPVTDAGVFIGYDPQAAEWKVLATGLEDHAAGAYFQIETASTITAASMITLEAGDVAEPPYLIESMPDGSYQQTGATRGLTANVLCVTVTAGDYDNDGDVDVYLGCRGGVENLYNRLYLNDGQGNFTAVRPHGAEGVLGFHLADRAGLADSAVTADYDLDGCLDIFVSNGLPLQPGRHDSGPDQLFRNDCTYGSHWVQIDLEGAGVGGTNRSAIGAKVYVTTATPAGDKVQVREQHGAYHRWSQDSQRLHFGLGASSTIKQIHVVWPTGEQTFTTFSGSAIPANRIYHIQEGANALALMTPGGGAFPTPKSGDECGVPTFHAKLHDGVFLYKDCTTGVWSVRASAGYSETAIKYEGTVSYEGDALKSLVPFSLEGADVLDAGSTPGRIAFKLGMKTGGVDGFDFKLGAGANGCFAISAPPGTKLYVGGGSLPAQWPLSLDNLGSCNVAPPPQADASCGAPNYDRASEAGVFLWRDCPSDTWHMRVTAGGGSKVIYEGRVTSASAIGGSFAGFSLENSDVLDVTDPRSVAYRLIVSNAAQDGLDFQSPAGAGTCVGVSAPGGAPIYLGAGRKLMQGGVNLDTLGTCTAAVAEAACGRPDFAAGSERGLFLWRECPTDTWQVRAAAGGPERVTFEGEVTAAAGFPAEPVPFGLEGADELLTLDAQRIGFFFKVANAGQDGFAFEQPGDGDACLEMRSDGGASIYLGAGKEAAGDSVSLGDLEACSG